MNIMAYNKFLVAALMAAVTFVQSYFEIDLGVDQVTASNLIAAIAAILVYFIPNVPPKPTRTDPMDGVQDAL
ncbi:hypothetical protein GCM10011491_42790 [Brucella endophytica]|uniref:Holin n=1 Tax=Brucella endophytica TaxID=1963359 RepID=A0A916SRX2_9HYPH|nr:hypothetical protein [Brucella endophytica]GGB10270.1 hypothetical protein GCM10011491_42790 [Brucella endophytica]